MRKLQEQEEETLSRCLLRITLRELALVGLAGLFMSVALAWLLALISNPIVLDQSPLYRHNVAMWRWQEEKGFGTHRIKVDPIYEDVYYLPAAHILSVVNELATYEDNVESLPRRRPAMWSSTRGMGRPPSIEGARAIYWREEAYGWPFLCFRQQWILPSIQSQLQLIGGVDLGFGRRMVGNTAGLEKGLPLTVIWLGLVANAVVVASSAMLLSRGIKLLVARSRLLRNMCPSCAYNLRGNESACCPECGWRHKQSDATPAAGAL